MNRLKQITLLFGDMLALYVGFYFAVAERYLEWPTKTFLDLLAPLSALFILVIVIFFITGLYDTSRSKNTWDFYQKIIITSGIWLTFSIIFFYISNGQPRNNLSPKTILLLTAINSFGLTALWRYLYNRFLSTSLWKTHLVFAGMSQEVEELLNLTIKQPECGLVVDGFIVNQTNDLSLIKNYPTLISGNTLAEVVKKNKDRFPELIIIDPSQENNPKLLTEIYEALVQQVSIINLAEFYEKNFKRIPPFTFSESWFATHLHEQQKKTYDRFRILIDYSAAIIMSAVFAVTFPITALAIHFSSPGPIFFKQTRIGRRGKPFNIYKLRTMVSLSSSGSAEINGPQYATTNDTRITPVGKFLRQTRLDEIPQFLNILKGEMAFIGPRPERPEFVKELSEKMPFYPLRHFIKPGLTGWAQIQKSYYGTIDENLEKLQYDLYYLKNRNFLLDCVILLKTIDILARRIGR